MNGNTNDLDQTEEGILTDEVSDEALEAAAAGTGERAVSTVAPIGPGCTFINCG